jgi:hypothetical protein
MGCISFVRNEKGGRVQCVVDEDECVDCEICFRAGVCHTDALRQPPTEWPRSIRGTFSNPLAIHKETKVPGRGTEEIKTNDITNRYKRGYAGISAELGRPGIGARLRDAERVFMALAPLGVEFEKQNPLTHLVADLSTGRMKADVIHEKVLSCIVETVVPLEKVMEVLDTLEKVAGEVDAVFSLDLVCRTEDDSSVPVMKLLDEKGRWYAKNGKTNLGLGKLTISQARDRVSCS